MYLALAVTEYDIKWDWRDFFDEDDKPNWLRQKDMYYVILKYYSSVNVVTWYFTTR